MGFMNLSFLKKYNFNKNLPIHKKIILINVIIFCLPLVINTVLFLFNLKTHSFFSFFELNPELDYFFKNIS